MGGERRKTGAPSPVSHPLGPSNGVLGYRDSSACPGLTVEMINPVVLSGLGRLISLIITSGGISLPDALDAAYEHRAQDEENDGAGEHRPVARVGRETVEIVEQQAAD